MKRFFRKFATTVTILVVLLSMSITVCAYYTHRFGVNVAEIKTAKFEVLVNVIKSEKEETIQDSYTFSGEEGENGVRFHLTGAGTASSGYCKVILKEQSFYTKILLKGEFIDIYVKGSVGDVVKFEPYWGKHGITDEALLLHNESVIGVYTAVPSPTPAPTTTEEPSPVPTATEEPTATAEASPSPTPTTTEEPTATAEPSPSPTPTATETVEPSQTPSLTTTEETTPTSTSEPTAQE